MCLGHFSKVSLQQGSEQGDARNTAWLVKIRTRSYALWSIVLTVAAALALTPSPEEVLRDLVFAFLKPTPYRCVPRCFVLGRQRDLVCVSRHGGIVIRPVDGRITQTCEGKLSRILGQVSLAAMWMSTRNGGDAGSMYV